MKQFSIDIAFNLCIDAIYNSNICEIDKIELLAKLREEYLKMQCEQEVIETIDYNFTR